LQAKRLAKIGAVLNPDQRKAFGEMKSGAWHGGSKGTRLPAPDPIRGLNRASSPDAAAALQRSRSISPTTISMIPTVSQSLS
jgi:hypothetical protein